MKRVISVLLVALLIVAMVPATALAATTKTVFVSRNGGNARINLRKGPGYDYETTGNLVRHNDKVTVQKTDDEWTKVKVSRTGKTGWIRTYYVDGTTKKLGTGTKEIKKATKVYAGADTESAVLGALEVGDTVKVFYTERDFASVTVTGSSLKGWIPMRCIGGTVDPTPDKPASGSKTVYRVKTNGGTLNVRAGAGTKYKVVNSLPNGTAFTVLKSSGSWRRIKTFNGVVGWVSKNYIAKNATVRVATNGSNLHVRKGAGTNTAVLGSLPNGARITVKSAKGNWAYMTHGKLTGWVSLNWLDI